MLTKFSKVQNFHFMISREKLLEISKKASRININSRSSINYMSKDNRFFKMNDDDSQRVYISYEDEDKNVVNQFFEYSKPKERNEQHSIVRSIAQRIPPPKKPHRQIVDLSNTNMNLAHIRLLFDDILGA